MTFYRKSICYALFVMLFLVLATDFGHTQNFISGWQERATRTQAEQPHWVTPLVTVTPRLEQELRTDFVRQITPERTTTWNYDNGKGLELIPSRHIELLFNLPPFVQHNKPKTADGFGDVTFLGKYRILAGNEEHKGGYIVTAFVGGSIPTGSYKNGLTDATVTPTLAGGKGWRRVDFQTTLGAQLPVANAKKIGRPILWNTAFQYRVNKMLWPEVEFNSTYFKGGTNDGRIQTFATPGLLTRFHLHGRLGLTFGAGIQIATSQFHSYNHAVVLTARMPF